MLNSVEKLSVRDLAKKASFWQLLLIQAMSPRAMTISMAINDSEIVIMGGSQYHNQSHMRGDIYLYNIKKETCTKVIAEKML